ncbi:MAG: hypothetical protein NDJ92_20530 [Thermoanaerobaculia bacterium]|nr:hypothetical protein [Thermoanaerobaculia bacterium]
MHVASYEWVDPAAEKAPFPVYPGATRLPEQTDLVRRARAILRPGNVRASRVVLFETDAPIDAVASHFSKLYESGDGTPATVQQGIGDHAKDEAALVPVLAKLGVTSTPLAGKHEYRSALIAGGPRRPTISLQRPWRDLLGDRVIDRTLIMIGE